MWLHICARVEQTTERRTHMVKECQMYKGALGVLNEEMRKVDVCEMEKFSGL